MSFSTGHHVLVVTDEARVLQALCKSGVQAMYLDDDVIVRITEHAETLRNIAALNANTRPTMSDLPFDDYDVPVQNITILVYTKSGKMVDILFTADGIEYEVRNIVAFGTCNAGGLLLQELSRFDLYITKEVEILLTRSPCVGEPK